MEKKEKEKTVKTEVGCCRANGKTRCENRDRGMETVVGCRSAEGKYKTKTQSEMAGCTPLPTGPAGMCMLTFK